MESMETSEYTLIEGEEIHATAEHRVSGEGNSSRVLPNPSGSPKRRTPDTRGWRKWVGDSIHAIPGVSQSALVRAQMLIEEYGVKYIKRRNPTVIPYIVLGTAVDVLNFIQTSTPQKKTVDSYS